MTQVKLMTMDGVALRRRNNEEYFKIVVPVVGAYLKYYPFNQEDCFEGGCVLYKVMKITQELQEYWNGLYQERFEVIVEKV